MYILAGTNRLTITKHNEYRDKNVGLILTIEVDKNTIDINEFKTVIDDIVNNALDITVYNDSDEKVAILSGFHCEPSIIIKNGMYKAELINASENTFQLGRQKLMIEALENLTTQQTAAIHSQHELLNKQEKNISDLIMNIDKQTRTIAFQKENIISLEEQLAIQDEVAIELYEAQTIQNEYAVNLEELLANQEQINTEQDEALIELYEMLGGN